MTVDDAGRWRKNTLRADYGGLPLPDLAYRQLFDVLDTVRQCLSSQCLELIELVCADCDDEFAAACMCNPFLTQ